MSHANAHTARLARLLAAAAPRCPRCGSAQYREHQPAGWSCVMCGETTWDQPPAPYDPREGRPTLNRKDRW